MNNLYLIRISAGGIVAALLVLFLDSSLLFSQEGASGEADLSVAASDSPDPVQIGDEIAYTITLINSGNRMAENVLLSDALPAEMAFQALSFPGDWSCTTPEPGFNGPVTCGKANLEPENTSTFTIVVVPSTAGVVTNTIVVTAEADSNASNNHASVETTIVGQVLSDFYLRK